MFTLVPCLENLRNGQYCYTIAILRQNEYFDGASVGFDGVRLGKMLLELAKCLLCVEIRVKVLHECDGGRECPGRKMPIQSSNMDKTTRNSPFQALETGPFVGENQLPFGGIHRRLKPQLRSE